MESKEKSDTNYLQKKQANRHIQVCGYQRGKVHGEGKIESLGLTDTHYYVYKTDKQQDSLYSRGNHNRYVVRCSAIPSLKPNVPYICLSKYTTNIYFHWLEAHLITATIAYHVFSCF